MLTSGTPAPDISAVTQDGTPFHLKDFRGTSQVVLFFYPEDDTGGCTVEACEFRDAEQDYSAANTVVFGVSLDTAESHKHFIAKNNLNFPLLVDTEATICDAFGVERNGHQPHRVTFLIDRNGVIARVWEKFNVRGHAAEVHAAALELVNS